jgi:hypothetical protein
MELNKYECNLLEENKDYIRAYIHCSLEMIRSLKITKITEVLL